MTPLIERSKLMLDIDFANKQGARLKTACALVGLSIRAIQRWSINNSGDKRAFVKKLSPKAFSIEEKNKIVAICNSPEYKDESPNKIVPKLAENGIYIGSESTFYKVLKEFKLQKHRANSRQPIKRSKTEHTAKGPLQVLSWDITYLKSSVRGMYFYLYLFMDIWSRKIVGCTVEESESGEIASNTIEKICLENNIEKIYLHSDNGSPMKCGTMLATLNWLGVTPSFSRPRVSNDNPFSESLFKTLKYRPGYPLKFDTIEEARVWVEKFVDWYNNAHLHSGILFVTPAQRHSGEDREILKKRTLTYIAARQKNPLRWVGNVRNWDYIEEVTLNKKVEKHQAKKIA